LFRISLEEVIPVKKSPVSELGFTLIELMIVILIIAILVAIAVPVFISARGNAQRRTCQANLRTIDGAINTYDAQYDAYPNTGLVNSAAVGFVPTVIKRTPSCPTTNSVYALGAGVGGAPPTVSCPTGETGHAI
jgi:prepilin-type N-terminal cleavage/methylation domain-containing protein